MRHNLKRLRDSHFTFDGVLDQVAKFMRGGERDSDLRCETDIPLHPGLTKFDSLSSMFATADKNMDGTLDLGEIKNVFRALVLKTPDGLDVKIPLHEAEGILASMDVDHDGSVSRLEWARGSDVLRSVVLRLAS